MPSRVVETLPAQKMGPPKPTAEASTERQMVPAASKTKTMEEPPPSILTLSFGGVDFSLFPRADSDGTVTYEAMGATEAFLNLKNFTGALRVVCNVSNQSARQDSVTPSPVDKHSTRPSPNQHQLVARTQVAESPDQTEMTRKQSHSSTATTPPTSNGSGKENTRRCSNVEQVMAANRSSPLPYHSPVKRNRSQKEATTKQQQQQPVTKKTKQSTFPLSQVLPPTPITMQKTQSSTTSSSHSKRLSEPDCSQTQPSSSSQVSVEEHSEESGVKLTQCSQQFQSTNDGNKSADDDDKEDQFMNEDDESVATRKAEDEDDESIATKNSEEDAVMEDKETTSKAPGKEEEIQEETTDEAMELVKALPPPINHSPSNRWGHTMTMIDHNRILVYGGQGFEESNGNIVPTTLSDLHVFSLEKKQWFQPIHCDDKSRKFPVQWSTSTFIPQRSLLIVFGGESMSKSGKMRCADKNNLMVLDTEILLWYPPSVSGDLPTGRSGHTSTFLPSSSNNELVVFGGVKGGKHLNTVSVLDTKAWRWSTPKIQGTKPAARSYHSATAIQATHCGEHSDSVNNKTATINIRQRIVVFGGNDCNKSYNSVSVLEKIEGATSTWRWFHPTVSGKPPRARTGHTATLLADGTTICVQGGWDPSDDDDNLAPGDDDSKLFFEDSYLLDTNTWTWKVGPTPVFAGHSLDASQGTDFGGRRAGHCAVLNTSNKAANEVLLFGGRVPGDKFAGDFQTLTIS